MRNLIQDGAAWLAGVQRNYVATSVRCRRGGSGGSSIPLNVTVAETTEQIEDTSGILVDVRIRDYLILAADFNFGGLTQPKAGDQIIESDGAVFEFTPKASEGVWRWWDKGRTRYRVHTKQVAAT